MVSANMGAKDNERILSQLRAALEKGIESVTTISSRDELQILSMAGSESTGWVQYATTWLAQRSLSASTAWQSVSTVSTMSSTRMQVRSLTSPIMCMTCDSLALGRRLSIMAKSVSLSCLANARALTTPPTSGETTMGSW